MKKNKNEENKEKEINEIKEGEDDNQKIEEEKKFWKN